MIMTITYVLAFLVALNFILLFTSCNKIIKKKTSKKTFIVKNETTKVVTKQLAPTQLAPTGS